MSVYQWTGSNNADLANQSNWVNVSNPGTVGTPGLNDVAIIQVGQGLYGVIDVAALDIVQASGAPIVSIVGSSTQVTAASVGIGYGFVLDDGAYLQAGDLGIDGDGTSVTVQNDAYLYDIGTQTNDVLTIGAGAGNCSVVVTKGGSFSYDSTNSTGTLNLGGALNSVTAMTISDDGYFSSDLSSFNIGAASGSTGSVLVTGRGSQFLLDNYGYTTIGDFGERNGSAQGTFRVTAGGYASLDSYGEVDIGTSAGMAKVIVSGTNSAIQAGPIIEVGVYGTNIAGEILVQAGGEFDAGTDTYLNNGTISVSGPNSLYTGRILGADNGGRVQVSAGGLIHVADVELAGEVILADGSVDARAGFYLYGGSEIMGRGVIAAANLGNAGLILANGGTLEISASITGTGVERINTGATLELDDSAAVSQTVEFSGARGVLALESPSTFKARIIKFVAGDTLDLKSLAYVSGATAAFSGYNLILKDGAASYTLRLRGAEAAAYKVVADSTGGTEILATNAAAVRALTDAAAVFGAPGALLSGHALSATPMDVTATLIQPRASQLYHA